MATIVKTPSGTWKALVRKNGWPTASKTFRTKRDAQDWARRAEDEMVRGVYIDRSGSERLTLQVALERYLSEISKDKRPSTARSERHRAEALASRLGDYSLAALTPDIIARYRDGRLGEGKSSNTVRLELALLSQSIHCSDSGVADWAGL